MSEIVKLNTDERPIEVLMDESIQEDKGLINKIGRYAKFRRFDTGAYGRGYAVLGQEFKEPTLCRGLTGFLDFIPDKNLSQVKVDFATKYGVGYKDVLSDLANFGTFGHLMTGQLTADGFIHTGTQFEADLIQFMGYNGISMHRFNEYYNLLSNYMFSMACFFYETDFKLMAAEFPVVDFEKKIATAIDLVGEMNDPKNPLRRINVCINLKFRMNAAVYDKDYIQTNIELMMMQNLIQKKYIKLPSESQVIHKTFILCPKNIKERTRDNYLLKDTTGFYDEAEYNLDFNYFKAKKLLDQSIDKPMPKFKGVLIKLGETPQYETIRQRMNNLFDY